MSVFMVLFFSFQEEKNTAFASYGGMDCSVSGSDPASWPYSCVIDAVLTAVWYEAFQCEGTGTSACGSGSSDLIGTFGKVDGPFPGSPGTYNGTASFSPPQSNCGRIQFDVSFTAPFGSGNIYGGVRSYGIACNDAPTNTPPPTNTPIPSNTPLDTNTPNGSETATYTPNGSETATPNGSETATPVGTDEIFKDVCDDDPTFGGEDETVKDVFIAIGTDDPLNDALSSGNARNICWG